MICWFLVLGYMHHWIAYQIIDKHLWIISTLFPGYPISIWRPCSLHTVIRGMFQVRISLPHESISSRILLCWSRYISSFLSFNDTTNDECLLDGFADSNKRLRPKDCTHIIGAIQSARYHGCHSISTWCRCIDQEQKFWCQSNDSRSTIQLFRKVRLLLPSCQIVTYIPVDV